MDYVLLILTGLVIGFIVAAPIGPINLICIRRTLAFGSLNGLISGFGATAADGIFAAIIGFGLTAIRHWFEGWSETLQIAGGVLLIGFGIHTYLADPLHGREFHYESGHHHKLGRHGYLRAFASTFAIALSNPATLFAFAALFTGFGGIVASEHASLAEAAFVVGGVMVGSGLWWLTMTSVVGLLHARIDAHVMRIITHTSGIVVTLFGLGMLARALWARWV
ncbi:MAG TPA: LysE family transporter [Rhizomicrobium sp.]|jgi:threonine/homoserine/homoserine lactone efflux protein|nr:LysE family transporter [Rhizomicrobium sp.]